MSYQSTVQETLACSLEITTSARKGIMKWSKDERAFFSMQDAFNVHIEKRPTNRHGNMPYSIFFDNETNHVLSKQLDDRVAVMDCVYKNDGFLVTGFQVRGRRELVRTNRRLPVRLKFNVGRSTGAAMPIELYTSIRELPIAEERSEYVEKRIASWEGYLQIEERNADVADVTSVYSMASLNEDFSKLSLICSSLNGKDWNAIKGFSAKIKDSQNDIGNVVNVNRSKSLVEIELNQKYKGMARRNEWQPKSFKEVVFSNFAALSQVRRLRKGFKDLQDGLAANANLEKVLFEERPVVRISKKQEKFVFHNKLNKFQKEAVTGAMTSNDLYVIQGPPGTGKTTVISEICHQNVKAGLRTLVASQANLAVDNALGRLLSHQDIRILRYGRTESIEEEGKKFIEENVALNWKEQTVHAINEQLESHSKREIELKEEIVHCENLLQEFQNELVVLDGKIQLRNEAQAEHLLQSKKSAKLRKKISDIKEERDELIQNQAALKQSADELKVEIIRMEQLFESESISLETIEQMEKLEEQVELLRKNIHYLECLKQIEETKKYLTLNQNEIDIKKGMIGSLQQFLENIQSITKLEALKNHMATTGIVSPFATDWKMTELSKLIDTIKSNISVEDYEEWRKLNERLLIAIEKIELLLKENGFIKRPVNINVNPNHNSIKGINELIDRVGRFLIDPATKKSMETRSYSPEKYDNLEKIGIALELLVERKKYAQTQGANAQKQSLMILESKKMFVIIKTEIIEYVTESILAIEKEKNALTEDTEERKNELTRLLETSSALRELFETIEEKASIDLVKEEVQKLEKVRSNYVEKRIVLENIANELDRKKRAAEVSAKRLEENAKTLQLLNEECEPLNIEYLEIESTIASLAELLKENPEEQREQKLASFYELSKELEQLQIDKERLPITHALQKEWFSHLTEASDYDLDEIRKLYVKHANVIGTTCVASARRDFMEEYPTFDVVIIDEVSKATPPELLLPMLKGKKIILVGDHHQLPPLMGQETLEELLEESDNREVKNELKKLLEESLFERLFRTLPKQNKTMLGIQYRMHESIMETITPFYEEGNYSLQCGLTDSDSVRDHLIESRYVQRKDHLLWFDMPNEPNYFEDKVKGGTSRFNQAELDMTKKILLDLDAATEKAKKDGRMKQEDKKSVGVISFYGEQVKRIDRLIQHELVPEHLNCRTGSVDKFQGMEMDVIILSFVRNHKDKGGDIGFARDYRRLNVALSRARELLIIVGSSEMFTMRTKHPSTKEMYGRLLENIKLKNGFRDHEGKIKL
ncbi:DEAD/DEAH box helicase [Sporosarcina sp. G11-34]|uniref:DEAD/DEAH box helicase n=1 Tax=Sporosarcina sp. G11-34 TaxID=2849605 RepID=UPI0022A984C7|nr:AAA domain-containing protein [Sporosarcina sp. G11-34]MCZ2258206.1 AAA family ATPase [Sporosarcina sp. G11-34]